MNEQELIEQFLSLNSNIQLFQCKDEGSEEMKLLKASLMATQEALTGLKQNNKSIYRPWVLKCFEFMDYLYMHQANSSES